MNHTETENKKEAIYNMLLEGPMTVLQIARKLNSTQARVHNYLRTMTHGENVKYETVFQRDRYINIYRANKRKPYVKREVKAKPVDMRDVPHELDIKMRLMREAKENKQRQRVEVVSPNARIIRLLEAPLPTPKRTRNEVNRGIVSSFSMFDSY